MTFLANPRYTHALTLPRLGDLPGRRRTTDRNIAILRVKIRTCPTRVRPFLPRTSASAFVHPTAVIDSSARVGRNVAIGACSRSAMPRLETMFPFTQMSQSTTTLRSARDQWSIQEWHCERTVIGERVVIHNNSVIGCDGFGYAKDEERTG